MVSVTIPHGVRERAGGLGLHLACGSLGLVVATVALAAWYPALAPAVARALGLLSTTTIVVSLLVGWLALWIGLEFAVARLSR